MPCFFIFLKLLPTAHYSNRLKVSDCKFCKYRIILIFDIHQACSDPFINEGAPAQGARYHDRPLLGQALHVGELDAYRLSVTLASGYRAASKVTSASVTSKEMSRMVMVMPDMDALRLSG